MIEYNVAAAAANAHIEGDEYAFTAVTPTVRLGNYTQISRKTVIVSGTQQAGNNAGRDSEMAYQLAKNSKALKRDMETALTSKVAKAVGATGTARTLGGLETWTDTTAYLGDTGPASWTIAAGSGVGGIDCVYPEAPPASDLTPWSTERG